MRVRRARGQHGQASLEVLALLPILLIAAVAGVQVVALLASASAAQDHARRRAMAATGDAGRTVRVEGVRTVPAMPLVGGALPAVTVRAAVRVP